MNVNKDPNRPFDPEILKQAKSYARRCTLVIEPNDDLGYFGRTKEFEFVMGDGKTIEKCAASVREATALAAAALLECGQQLPFLQVEAECNG